MAKSTASTPVSSRNAKNVKMNGSVAGGLTLSEVYDMTADVGKHMQAIASEYGTRLLEPLAEMVIRALEHLEWYVEENERMRTVNCKLLLEADQVAAERDSKKELETEVAVRESERRTGSARSVSFSMHRFLLLFRLTGPSAGSPGERKAERCFSLEGC